MSEIKFTTLESLCNQISTFLSGRTLLLEAEHGNPGFKTVYSTLRRIVDELNRRNELLQKKDFENQGLSKFKDHFPNIVGEGQKVLKSEVADEIQVDNTVLIVKTETITAQLRQLLEFFEVFKNQ